MTENKEEFLKKKWEDFKNDKDEFWKGLCEVIKENDFDSTINIDRNFFENLWCIDFETETEKSPSFIEYQKENNRTRSRVNYFFMVKMSALKNENLGKWEDKFNRKFMLEGTSIDEIFDYFYNSKSTCKEIFWFFHNINFDGVWIKQWLDNHDFELWNENGYHEMKLKSDFQQVLKYKKELQDSGLNIIKFCKQKGISEDAFTYQCKNNYRIKYQQGKITSIKITFNRKDKSVISIYIYCSLKLLASQSIESLGKTFKLNKKDKSIASTKNYENFLAKSYQPDIIKVYENDERYPFYCKRDVFIQAIAMLGFYSTIYLIIKNKGIQKEIPEWVTKSTVNLFKTVFTISKAAQDTMKACLTKEHQKYLKIDMSKRMIFDRETKGGLTNYNQSNELIVFHKNKIESMEFKNIGCDDIKSAYPFQLSYAPTGQVFTKEPDDYHENPSQYHKMNSIGYINIKPKNDKAQIGILKDYYTTAIYLLREQFPEKEFSEIWELLFDFKIDDESSEFNQWYLYKDLINFYGINKEDFHLSQEQLKEKFKEHFQIEKKGKLISQCSRYFTYGTDDYIKEIERYFKFDKKIIYSTYWFKLSDFLNDNIQFWFSLKENGKGAVKSMIKIFINSFYGKTAQGYIYPAVINMNDEVEKVVEGDYEYLDFKESNKFKEYIITSKISSKSKQYSKNNPEQYNCYLREPLDRKNANNKLIANWCCNQTQAMLLKNINDNNPENHIYSDTDSRIWLNNNIKKLKWGKKLGDWESEFLIEFVKVKGYDGYHVKLYKNSKFNDATIDTTKYRIIENHQDYFIFDKYYIMISIAIRQKSYFFVILDIKHLLKFNKYDADKLLSIFNNNNQNQELNETDIKLIVSEILTGYECEDTGKFITNNLILKKAHSGVKKQPSQEELFHLLLNGNALIQNKDMVEKLCDDGGVYFTWEDKYLDINRRLKVIDDYVLEVKEAPIKIYDENPIVEGESEIDVEAFLKKLIAAENEIFFTTMINQEDNDNLIKDVSTIFKKKEGDK